MYLPEVGILSHNQICKTNIIYNRCMWEDIRNQHQISNRRIGHRQTKWGHPVQCLTKCQGTPTNLVYGPYHPFHLNLLEKFEVWLNVWRHPKGFKVYLLPYSCWEEGAIIQLATSSSPKVPGPSLSRTPKSIKIYKSKGQPKFPKVIWCSGCNPMGMQDLLSISSHLGYDAPVRVRCEVRGPSKREV